jgi:hypothetical protein
MEDDNATKEKRSDTVSSDSRLRKKRPEQAHYVPKHVAEHKSSARGDNDEPKYNGLYFIRNYYHQFTLFQSIHHVQQILNIRNRKRNLRQMIIERKTTVRTRIILKRTILVEGKDIITKIIVITHRVMVSAILLKKSVLHLQTQKLQHHTTEE